MKKDNRIIDLNALKIFAEVADSDTITLAAQRLGVTQSAVSQTIKQLELHTGTELIVRRSRPIKLTQSGVILKDYADQMMAATRKMMVDIRLASGGGFAKLHVGMVDSFGDVAGLQFVSQIKPYVARLALRTGLNAPLEQDLLNRDLDILVTSDPIDGHPELRCYPILRDPFVMIVPEQHSQEGHADPAWLSSHLPFVQFSRRSRIGAMTRLVARRLDLEPSVHYELDSTQTLMRFVQSGMGWGMLSALCLVRYPELLQGVRVINISGGANARYLYLICREQELGELPDQMASICRSIYTEEVVPQLIKIAPWFEQQAYAVEQMPVI